MILSRGCPMMESTLLYSFHAKPGNLRHRRSLFRHWQRTFDPWLPCEQILGDLVQGRWLSLAVPSVNVLRSIMKEMT